MSSSSCPVEMSSSGYPPPNLYVILGVVIDEQLKRATVWNVLTSCKCIPVDYYDESPIQCVLVNEKTAADAKKLCSRVRDIGGIVINDLFDEMRKKSPSVLQNEIDKLDNILQVIDKNGSMMPLLPDKFRPVDVENEDGTISTKYVGVKNRLFSMDKLDENEKANYNIKLVVFGSIISENGNRTPFDITMMDAFSDDRFNAVDWLNDLIVKYNLQSKPREGKVSLGCSGKLTPVEACKREVNALFALNRDGKEMIWSKLIEDAFTKKIPDVGVSIACNTEGYIKIAQLQLEILQKKRDNLKQQLDDTDKEIAIAKSHIAELNEKKQKEEAEKKQKEEAEKKQKEEAENKRMKDEALAYIRKLSAEEQEKLFEQAKQKSSGKKSDDKK